MTVGYERFLGPEMFFHPEIIDPKYRQPIDEIIDNAIQLSPIDTRRGLYENIVLSGGSTLFPGFITRLQNSLDERLEKRMSKYRKLNNSGSEGVPIVLTAATNKDSSAEQRLSALCSMVRRLHIRNETGVQQALPHSRVVLREGFQHREAQRSVYFRYVTVSVLNQYKQ